MARFILAPVMLCFAFPAVGGAQGSAFPTTPACPTSAQGTEVSLGADSAARRAAPQADTARGASTNTTIGKAPDIILRASVSAREVRFTTQPHISIRLCGGSLDSVRVLERRNLPTPVVAGTTYRDVYVAIEILGHLTGSCIANTLTGGRAAPNSAGPCASLGLRDSTAAQRAPATRRPK